MDMIARILRGKVFGSFVAIASDLTAKEKATVLEALGATAPTPQAEPVKSPETMTLAEVFAVIDARLAVGDLVSRDIANVIGALTPGDFGQDANPPVPVIRATVFPKTRQSAAAKSRLDWNFADGTDLTTASTERRVVRHVKAAARALRLTFNGSTVDYNSKIS